MKYIARCMVDMKGDGCENLCVHCYPHEFDSVRFGEGDRCIYCLGADHPCNCIPVPLSYYMKEVLNEDKNK